MRSSLSLLGLLLPIDCLADSFPVGDWQVSLDSGYSEAYTVNDSGSQFGIWCSSEGCVYYSDLQTQCEQGPGYQSLISSTEGANALKLHCVPLVTGASTRYVLLLSDFDMIDRIVNEGGVLGIAVALKSGEFIVSRFDLKNGSRACKMATSRAPAVKSRERIRDQRL